MGNPTRGRIVERVYAWLTRCRSARSRADEGLAAKVRASFLASDRTYGATRVWLDLLARGCAFLFYKHHEGVVLVHLGPQPERGRGNGFTLCRARRREETDMGARAPRRGAGVPSRKGAIFLVDSLEMAQPIVAEWFVHERRHVLEPRVLAGSKLHRADARWLNCLPEKYEENAPRYWAE